MEEEIINKLVKAKNYTEFVKYAELFSISEIRMLTILSNQVLSNRSSDVCAGSAHSAVLLSEPNK